MTKNIYLFRRNGGIYYYQLLNPITGKRTTAKSAKTTERRIAEDLACKAFYSCVQPNNESLVVTSLQQSLLKNELTKDDIEKLRSMLQVVPALGSQVVHLQAVEKKARTPFLQWLKNFWEYETSEYVQDKLSHGKKVSKRYCYDQTLIIKYWAEYFNDDTMLEDLTLDHLQKFEDFLWGKQTQKKRIIKDEKTGKKHVEFYYTQLSTKTRNNIIKCASIALEWAVRKKLVLENPCKGLTAYSVTAEKRDILNRQEVGKLFSVGIWKDERARVASLVAMTTGLRISEILALQESDIGEDRLFISRSWSSKDGLTTTKNGESRIVPLIPEVKKELYKLHFQNPYGENGGKFIFFGTLPDKPVVSNVITEDFKQAMESIGISEEQRKKRNIVFHSWRHFYATTIATELSEKHAQLTLGHLTQAMTKHYADHKTEEALMSVCSASNEIFSQMLHA